MNKIERTVLSAALLATTVAANFKGNAQGITKNEPTRDSAVYVSSRLPQGDQASVVAVISNATNQVVSYKMQLTSGGLDGEVIQLNTLTSNAGMTHVEGRRIEGGNLQDDFKFPEYIDQNDAKDVFVSLAQFANAGGVDKAINVVRNAADQKKLSLRDIMARAKRPAAKTQP